MVIQIFQNKQEELNFIVKMLKTIQKIKKKNNIRSIKNKKKHKNNKYISNI